MPKVVTYFFLKQKVLHPSSQKAAVSTFKKKLVSEVSHIQAMTKAGILKRARPFQYMRLFQRFFYDNYMLFLMRQQFWYYRPH